MNKLLEFKTATDDFAVEYEILPIYDLTSVTDARRIEIFRELQSVEDRIDAIEKRVSELNADIDKLTNHADGLDYTIAVASGLITGLIDSFFVGEFSLDAANTWGSAKVNSFVVNIAKSQGYKGDELLGAVEFLEKKFPIAADKATNAFGGGRQHHLRDFSHHPTPIGLIFSLLTQFTGKVYGTNTMGAFDPFSLEANSHLVGRNIPEKLMFGVVNWFFHMASDMAGSSGSINNVKSGTGLPGPIVSLLKELSALPVFRNMNENGHKEFSVWISKLFNGTWLDKRDASGKIIEAVKFDLRTEIGIAHELGKQAMPVIINECIVRGFYFVRRLIKEVKNRNVKSIADLRSIDWQSTLPFKNRTIVRMLTIATGTFTAVDLADAAIRSAAKSGGNGAAFLANFVLRVNFVGVGRFAVAVGSDIKMGYKKGKLERERMQLQSEQLLLMDTKLFFKQADVWIEAESTNIALKEAYALMDKTAAEFAAAWNEVSDSSASRRESLDKIRKKDPEFAEELSDLFEWGI